LALDFLINRAIAKVDEAGSAAAADPVDFDFQKFMQHRELREAAAPLVAFGFSDKDAIAAMKLHAGDMPAALNYLIEAAAGGAIRIEPSAAEFVARVPGASRSPSPPHPGAPRGRISSASHSLRRLLLFPPFAHHFFIFQLKLRSMHPLLSLLQ
jgi:hypothetical protein